MQEHIRLRLMTIPPVIGVNPLQTTLLELGIVSGRVALLLRSAEIQPVFKDLYNMDPPWVHPPQQPPCMQIATGYVYHSLHLIFV
jgi:hypothetical protein